MDARELLRCRARYRGLAKTHRQYVIIAVAISVLRISSWARETPLTQTRCPHFSALQFRPDEFALGVNVGSRLLHQD